MHSFRSTSSRNGGLAAPKYDVGSAGRGDPLAQTPARSKDRRTARGIGRFVDAAGKGKEFVLLCLFSSLGNTFGASTKRTCRRKWPRTPHRQDTRLGIFGGSVARRKRDTFLNCASALGVYLPGTHRGSLYRPAFFQRASKKCRRIGLEVSSV